MIRYRFVPSRVLAIAAALAGLASAPAQACVLCDMASESGGACPLHGAAASTAPASTSTRDPVAAFQVDDRWNNFSGGVAIGSAGIQGDPITLTWSIVPDGTTIVPAGSISGESSNNSNLVAMLNTEFGSSTVWMPLIESAFDRWSELSGVTFVHESNDDGAAIGDDNNANRGIEGVRGDHRLSGHLINGLSGTLAYNYFPNRSDMVLDTADGPNFDNTGNNYRFFRNTLMHEIGHGLGFSHVESNNASLLMEPFISTSFDGPQLDDILAAHRNYGDVYEKSNNGQGNDVFGNATPLGFIDDQQTVSIGTDAADVFVASTDVDFVSIDDNSDVDFFSFVVDTPSEVDLLLRPRGPTYNEGPEPDTGDPIVYTPLNTSALSNLSLQLFDTNGTSSLGFADNTGAGSAESLNDIFLSQAGTYFVRIAGADDNVQLYQLDVSVITVPEPAAIALALAALLFAGGWVVIHRKRARFSDSA